MHACSQLQLQVYSLHCWPLFPRDHRGTVARAFSLKDSISGLVPFADCLNHAKVPIHYGLDATDEVFTMKTENGFPMVRFPSPLLLRGLKAGRVHMTSLADVGQGTEVFNNYGDRSNAVFLAQYGFALETNPNEAFTCTDGSEVRAHHRFSGCACVAEFSQ